MRKLFYCKVRRLLQIVTVLSSTMSRNSFCLKMKLLSKRSYTLVAHKKTLRLTEFQVNCMVFSSFRVVYNTTRCKTFRPDIVTLKVTEV